MAIITIGNNHLTKTLQPGWTVNDDTYGLFTGVCTFEIDESLAYPTSEHLPFVGQAHPINVWNFMKADKISYKQMGGSKMAVSVTYIGIYGSGTGIIGRTKPNVQGTSGTSTEPIELHENFFKAPAAVGDPPVAVYTGIPIAGVGTGTTTPTIAPEYPKSSIVITPGKPPEYYTGNHGSQFTNDKNGKFVGFFDPAYPAFYGKKSYMNPVNSWTGFVYTTSMDDALWMKKRNCCVIANATSGTGTYVGAVQVLPPEYGSSWTAASGYQQLLLTNVGIEKFSASIYKITYTIRFSADGFPGEVYAQTR